MYRYIDNKAVHFREYCIYPEHSNCGDKVVQSPVLNFGSSSFSSSSRLFQADHELPITGLCDAKTRAVMIEVIRREIETQTELPPVPEMRRK